MTRRQFLSLAPAAALAAPTGAHEPVVLPIRHILDSAAKWAPGEMAWYWSHLWPEAARDLAHCGIQIHDTLATGAVERPPGREPILGGLEHGVVNLLITNRIPMEWDQGRTLSGVTTRYRGYHVCLVALDHAHGHQVPLLSLNTCTHELLHALMLDILEDRPSGLEGQLRELRIDWFATRLWLFHDGAAVGASARRYVRLLPQIG